MNCRARLAVVIAMAVLLLCGPLSVLGQTQADGGCLNYSDYMHVVASLPLAAQHLDRAGDYVYLSSLQVLDVSGPGEPAVVGSFAGQEGQVHGIAATETSLFVIYSAANGAGFNGLAIYDRADPVAPVLLSTLRMPQFMTQMRIIGDRAYLRNDQGLMLLVDVSDPAQPVVHGTIGQSWLDSFDVSGNLLYAVDNIRNDVVVVDVTDMDNLQVDFRLNLPDVISITFNLGYGYFLAANAGTNVLEFTAADQYTVVGDLPDLTRPLVIHDGLGYTYGNPLQVYGLDAPAAPNLIVTVPFVVHDGVLAGGRALLGISNAFAEMDLTNTADLPGLAATVDLAADLTTMIDADDQLITLSWAGLKTYDTSDCLRPQPLGSLMWQERVRGQALVGDYLYVLTEGASFGRVVLKVFDLSDPSAPVEVAAKNLNGDLQGLTVVGEFLYSAEHGALILIRIADPLNPSMFSRIDGVGFTEINAVVGDDMVVSDGLMLRHFDVSVSDNPVLQTAIDTGVAGRQVLLSDGVAYLAHRGGVKLYEVLNTGTKNLLADLTVPGVIDWIALDDRTLYVEGSGIYFLDVSDAHLPQFVGNLGYVAERAVHLMVMGDCLYFDQYTSGDRGRLNIAHRHCTDDGPQGPVVVIDIKPGSDENPINCESEHGVIPVAILTTADFDALSVDNMTVRFGPGEISEVHSVGGNGHGNGYGHDADDPREDGALKRHEEDVDGDGDIDLVFHFSRGEADIACGDTEAWLTGETFDGTAFSASDVVRTSHDDVGVDDDDGNHGHDADKLVGDQPTLSLAPNPFNPATTIAFNLPQSVHLRVEVYDMTGRRVAIVADHVFGPGMNRVVWQGADESGRPAASGVYFVRLNGQGVDLRQRAVLLK